MFVLPIIFKFAGAVAVTVLIFMILYYLILASIQEHGLKYAEAVIARAVKVCGPALENYDIIVDVFNQIYGVPLYHLKNMHKNSTLNDLGWLLAVALQLGPESTLAYGWREESYKNKIKVVNSEFFWIEFFDERKHRFALWREDGKTHVEFWPLFAGARLRVQYKHRQTAPRLKLIVDESSRQRGTSYPTPTYSQNPPA